MKFHFDREGSFKILQFTDLHLNLLDGTGPEARTLAFVERAIRTERPDLAIVTGDLVSSVHSEDCMRGFVAFMDRIGTPWAFTFGNHDAEYGASADILAECLVDSRCCLFRKGDPSVAGTGNYVVTIDESDDREGAGRPAWALFFLDSGDYTAVGDRISDGYFRASQIRWFRERSAGLANGQGPLPSLCFFHIPLVEFDEVWDHSPCLGSKHESVCSPLVNSGFFAALVETGNVRGVYVGHDHVNDYSGELHGIRLGYGRGSGYSGEGEREGAYGLEGWLRGSRAIVLERTGDFRSYLFLEDGARHEEGPLHQPERERD